MSEIIPVTSTPPTVGLDEDERHGDRIIVSRLRKPTPLGRTILVEFHYRNRRTDDPGIGRYGFQVAFFEVDDATAGLVADALLKAKR